MQATPVVQRADVRTPGLLRCVLFLGASAAVSLSFLGWDPLPRSGGREVWLLLQSVSLAVAAILVLLAYQLADSEGSSFTVACTIGVGAALCAAALLLLEAVYYMVVVFTLDSGSIPSSSVNVPAVALFFVLFCCQWLMTGEVLITLSRSLRRSRHPDDPY